MVLEGTNRYFGTGSDLEYTIDHKTWQRRKSTLEDVELSARICDKLENIDFVMSYALPGDVPPSAYESEQFRVLLENTSKPVIMTVFSGMDSFAQMHKLAVQSCGGQDEFRKAPNYLSVQPVCLALTARCGCHRSTVFLC